jgi:hypothetical protein
VGSGWCFSVPWPWYKRNLVSLHFQAAHELSGVKSFSLVRVSERNFHIIPYTFKANDLFDIRVSHGDDHKDGAQSDRPDYRASCRKMQSSNDLRLHITRNLSRLCSNRSEDESENRTVEIFLLKHRMLKSR